MVSYFLCWTLLKFFNIIPNNQSTSSLAVGQITCAMFNTSNEVSCTILWEFWIHYISQRILKRVFVGSIVNIMNECLFSGFMGEWIEAQNKKILWFTVDVICLSHTQIHSLMNPEKRHSILSKLFLLLSRFSTYLIGFIFQRFSESVIKWLKSITMYLHRQGHH